MPEDARQDLNDACTMYSEAETVFDEWYADLQPVFERKFSVSQRGRDALRGDVARFVARQLLIDVSNYCAGEDCLEGERLVEWEGTALSVMRAIHHFVADFPPDLAASLLYGDIAMLFGMLVRMVVPHPRRPKAVIDGVAPAEATMCADELEAQYALLDEDDQILVLRYLFPVIQEELFDIYGTKIALFPEEADWLAAMPDDPDEYPYLSDWAGRLIDITEPSDPRPLYPERLDALFADDED